MEKEKIQEIAFTMIANIGGAKYKALQAFTDYKNDGDKEKATKLLQEAEKDLGNAGTKHLDVISAEAAGEDIQFSMILLHAEDQYMTVQMMIEILLLLVK